MAVTRSRRAQGGIFGSGREVHNLKQTSIQPTPVPSTPFVQAPRYEAGGNLIKLAQSLTNLNQSLNNLANVNAREQADPDSRENQEYAAKLQQMNLAELKHEAHNNTHGGVRIKENILNRLMADKTVANFKLAWDEFYNTEFDKTGGNLDEAYEAFRLQYADALPTNISKGLFYQLTEGTKQLAQEADQQQKIDYAVGTITSSLTDNFRNTIDDALHVHGKTEAEAAQLVISNGAQLAEFMSLSPQERDDALLKLVEEYALQGNVTMVEALLDVERAGQDGEVLAKRYAIKAQKLIQQAYSVRRSEKLPLDFQEWNRLQELSRSGQLSLEEAEEAVRLGHIKEGEAKSFLLTSQAVTEKAQEDLAKEIQKNQARDVHYAARDRVLGRNIATLGYHNSLHNLREVKIPNEQGTGWTTITPKEQTQAVLDYKDLEWEREYNQLVEGGAEPQAALDAINTKRLDFYAAHGFINKEWENALTGLPLIATVERLTKDENTAKDATERARLYFNLKSQNPVYLARLIGDDKQTQAFFDALEVNYAYRSGDLSYALSQAAGEVAIPEIDRTHRRLEPELAEELTNQVMAQLYGVDAGTPFNFETVKARIASLAKAGALPDKIAAQVEREIKNTHLSYHGVLLRDNGKMPPDFISLMDVKVGEIFDQFKDKMDIEDREDLYLVPDTTGTIWEVHSKTYIGAPLGRVTVQDLEQLRLETQAAQEATTRTAFEKAMAKVDAKIKYWDKLDKTPRPKDEASRLLLAQRQELTQQIDIYERQLSQLQQGTAYYEAIQYQLENLQDRRAILEGQELIERGILPDSEPWIKWKVDHGRDVSPIERIWRDEFSLSKEKK